jgi:hypothetical protein
VIELYRHLTLYLRLASAPEVAELYDLLQHPEEAAAMESLVRQAAASGVSMRDLPSDQRQAIEKFGRLRRQGERINNYLSSPDGARDDLYFAAPGSGWADWHGLGQSVKAFQSSGKISPTGHGLDGPAQRPARRPAERVQRQCQGPPRHATSAGAGRRING